MKRLTEQELLDNGFEKHKYFSDVYVKVIDGYRVEITHIANTKDEYWNCHIDDDRCCTVVNVEVDTYEHLVEFCDFIINWHKRSNNGTI